MGWSWLIGLLSGQLKIQLDIPSWGVVFVMKNRMDWMYFRMAIFPLFLARSSREFFSDFHCEYLVKLLEVKPTKVCTYAGAGVFHAWDAGFSAQKLAHIQLQAIHQLLFKHFYRWLSLAASVSDKLKCLYSHVSPDFRAVISVLSPDFSDVSEKIYWPFLQQFSC